MAITMTTSGAILAKAGKNVSVELLGSGSASLALTAEEIIEQFAVEAEHLNIHPYHN